MDILHEELAEQVLCSLGGVLYLDLLETSALHRQLAAACRDAAACCPKEAADVLAELVQITQAVAAHARHTRRLVHALTDTQAVLRGDQQRPSRSFPGGDGDQPGVGR